MRGLAFEYLQRGENFAALESVEKVRP